jgi:hypothetical protein
VTDIGSFSVFSGARPAGAGDEQARRINSTMETSMSLSDLVTARASRDLECFGCVLWPAITVFMDGGQL